MIEFKTAGTVISTTPTERDENTVVSDTYRNGHGPDKMKRNETMIAEPKEKRRKDAGYVRAMATVKRGCLYAV